MKNNETGEFELVLGNKQLLSGFAIVVILFGVFFTMGYIVGRNSTPPNRGADTTTAAITPGDAKQPSAAGAPLQTAPPVVNQESSRPAETAAAPAPEPGPTTQPAQDSQTAPAPAAKAAAQPPAQEPQLQPGASYLQVSAVARPEAEVVMNTLRNKGYPALIAPSPKEGLYRVLVGPYRDAASLGKAKSDLEALQFHPFLQK